MSAHQSVAQRLGRVLEAVTRQSGRLSETPAYGSLLLAGLPTLLWTSAPTYDPWAWIIWGREIVHGDLVTTTGPSWKPLQMVFTIPFAIFGKAEPDLWLWVSRAFALMGLAAAAQLAVRLGGRLAGGLAIVALVTTPLYYAYGIQGSSEGMLVLVCCLAATDWLDGKLAREWRGVKVPGHAQAVLDAIPAR